MKPDELLESSPETGGPEKDRSLQDLAYERIWVGLMERPWHSLGVVPSAKGTPASGVAQGIVRAGSEYLGEPLRLLHAEGSRLGRSRRLLESLSGGMLHGTVLSTDWPGESEAALLLARHVDAVLLLVPMGRARLSEVKGLVERIGRDRIVGAVIIGE